MRLRRSTPPATADTPLSVLHLVTSDAFAGIERHVVRLVSELRALGCVPVLACPPSALAMREAAKAAGVPVEPRSETRGPWLVRIATVAARQRPDVVHVHDGLSAAVGVVVASLAGAQLVRTQHFSRPASALRGGLGGAASMALHRRLNRRLDGFIAVSQSAAQSARDRRETTDAEVVVISPGIEVPADEAVAAATAEKETAAQPVVSLIGRFERERQLDVLVRAIPRVLEEAPGCRFLIAGAGSDEAELKALAHGLGVDHAIEWLGWLKRPETVLGRSDVYVNTLPWEGFGMATAEAMAFGLPVVAVNSGASPELVEHGVTGLLVAEGDSAAFAAAIIRLVADPGLARSMGAAGRRCACERYGAGRTARETLAFYERLRRTDAA